MGGGQRHAPVALPPGEDPVHIVQEARWAPVPIWTIAENLASNLSQPPDRPGRSDSLYRLNYAGPPLPVLFKTHENFDS